MKMQDVIDVLLERLNDPNGDRYEDIAYNEFWNAISKIVEQSDNPMLVAHGLVATETFDFMPSGSTSPPAQRMPFILSDELDNEDTIKTIFRLLDIRNPRLFSEYNADVYRIYPMIEVKEQASAIRPPLLPTYVGYSVSRQYIDSENYHKGSVSDIKLYPMMWKDETSDIVTVDITYIRRITRIALNDATANLLNIFSDGAISDAIDLAYQNIIAADKVG